MFRFLKEEFSDEYSIEDWEKTLEVICEDIDILGQIILNKKQVDNLKNKIIQESSAQENNFTYFLEVAPVTFSLFLMYIGSKTYEEGNFWNGIYEALEVDVEPPIYNNELGNIFYYTIESYNLKKFEVGRNKFVNQILAHSIVQNNYYEDFFENVIFKEFKVYLDSPLNKEKVVEKLEALKEDHKGYVTKKEELNEAQNNFRTILKRIETLTFAYDNYEELEQLGSLIDQKVYRKEISILLDKPANFLLAKERKLKSLKNEIKTLQKDKNTRMKKKKQDISFNVKLVDTLDRLKELFSKIKMRKSFDLYKSELYDLKEKIDLFSKQFQKLGREEKKSRKNDGFLLKQMMLCKNILSIILEENENMLNDAVELIPFFKKEKLVRNTLSQIEDILENILQNYYTPEKDKEIKKLEKKIDNIELKKEKAKKEINEYKMNLNIISGDKGVEEGLDELDKQRNLQERMNKILNELAINEERAEMFCETINNLNKEDLNRELRELKRLKRKYKNNIDELEDEKEKYFNRFYDIVEPIKIFVFQGGEIAEEFIYQNIRLLKILFDDEYSKENHNSVELPKSIIEAMEDWWEDYKTEIERKRIQSEKGRVYKPRLYFDLAQCDFYIKLPKQRLDIETTIDKPPILYIKDQEDKILRQRKLEIFREEQYLTTSEVKMNFPENKQSINVEVIIQDDKLLQKEFNIGDFMFFQDQTLINDPFNNEKAELILHKDFDFVPRDVLIQKENIIGAWNEYIHYYLDLKDIDNLTILNEEDEPVSFYSRKEETEPQLVGEKTSDYFNDPNDFQKKVYCNKIPRILFSVEGFEKLRLWQLNISHNNNHVFSEALNKAEEKLISVKDNIYQLPIEEFVKTKTGEFNVELEKRAQRRSKWDFSFIVLPDISVDFDQKMYLPKDCKNGKAFAEINAPKKYKIEINNSELNENNLSGEFNMEFDPREISLFVRIYSKEGYKEINLNLNLRIPVLTWQMKGSSNSTEESAEIKEIWYEDIINQRKVELLVNFPPQITWENSELFLDDKQTIEMELKDSTARVDLLKFSDVLRTGGESLEEVFISGENIEEKVFEKELLFNIRTEWEVKNFDWSVDSSENKWLLGLKWLEAGKTNHKEILVINKNGNKVFRKELSPESENISMSLKKENIMPGEYKIKFRSSGLWGEEKEMNDFKIENKNEFKIKIGSKEDIIKAIQEHGVQLSKVVNEEGDIYEITGDDYFISNIKPAEKTYIKGEERYTGDLYILKANGENVEFFQNPVQFYFDAEELSMPLLVDKDRDGFTYCRNCKILNLETVNSSHPGFEHKEEIFVPMRYFIKLKE